MLWLMCVRVCVCVYADGRLWRVNMEAFVVPNGMDTIETTNNDMCTPLQATFATHTIHTAFFRHFSQTHIENETHHRAA